MFISQKLISSIARLSLKPQKLQQHNQLLIKSLTNSKCFHRSFSTSTEMNQYSALNHSLIKSIYIFKHSDGYCGYIVKDEQTGSLILVDPGQYETAIEHVKIIEQQWKGRLTHILCTHDYQMTKDTHKFLKHDDSIKIVAGVCSEKMTYHNTSVKDIQPFSIGELAICFLHTPGIAPDAYTIAITQVNQTSTKLPVVFTGETLQICSVGDVPRASEYATLYSTLHKLKSFPSETLIFPAKDAQLENIVFAKSLDPTNPILNMKLSLAKQAFAKNTHILPTSLLEERACNPFLRTHDTALQKILNERNPIEFIKKLKLTQNQFFATSPNQ